MMNMILHIFILNILERKRYLILQGMSSREASLQELQPSLSVNGLTFMYQISKRVGSY